MGVAGTAPNGPPRPFPFSVPAFAALLALAGGAAGLAAGLELSLVTPGPIRGVLSEVAPIVCFGWAMAGLINFAFGVLLVAAMETGAWAAALFAVPLGMLHWADRGYAEARADRARVAGLQRATHVLVGPIDPRDAIPAYLAEVRSCFSVEVVELVLHEPLGYRVERLSAPDATSARAWTSPTGTETLAIRLLHGGLAARVSPAHPDEPLRGLLWEESWRDCLAAPLLAKGVARGVLCAYNRTGLEGSRPASWPCCRPWPVSWPAPWRRLSWWRRSCTRPSTTSSPGCPTASSSGSGSSRP